jgi:hypothetical protein
VGAASANSSATHPETPLAQGRQARPEDSPRVDENLEETVQIAEPDLRFYALAHTARG